MFVFHIFGNVYHVYMLTCSFNQPILLYCVKLYSIVFVHIPWLRVLRNKNLKLETCNKKTS